MWKWIPQICSFAHLAIKHPATMDKTQVNRIALHYNDNFANPDLKVLIENHTFVQFAWYCILIEYHKESRFIWFIKYISGWYLHIFKNMSVFHIYSILALDIFMLARKCVFGGKANWVICKRLWKKIEPAIPILTLNHISNKILCLSRRKEVSLSKIKWHSNVSKQVKRANLQI